MIYSRKCVLYMAAHVRKYSLGSVALLVWIHVDSLDGVAAAQIMLDGLAWRHLVWLPGLDYITLN